VPQVRVLQLLVLQLCCTWQGGGILACFLLFVMRAHHIQQHERML